MTYEYLCTACNHEWEATQSINDKPLKRCPACGKNTARRQVSGGTGFVLKGGGWYADGYASKSSDSAAPKAATEDSGSSSSDNGAKGKKKTESPKATTKPSSSSSDSPKST